MGAVSNIIARVREAFRQDKIHGGDLIAKGSTSPSFGDSGYDLLQSYGYDSVSDHLRLEHDLLSRYVDYEEMDDYPELAAALDIYADDSSQPDTQLRRTIWAVSPDKTVESLMDDLYHKQLRADEEIWEIARSTVKYGNDYEEMLITENGVVGLNFLPAPTVRRVEGPRGELYGFVQDFRGRFGTSPQEFQKALAQRSNAIKAVNSSGGHDSSNSVTAFEDWEIVHFRLRGKTRRSVYGYSVLEPARWIWKRLQLLEDAALIYRLQRAQERFAYYVDVGNLPPAESLAYLNRVRQQHKKKKFVNPSTGKMDFKWEPMSQDDDIFIPVRNGQDGARVEVLGSPSWQHMDDVEYFRSKMFAGIKVPKAYMNQDEGADRASLSSQDVRFARSALRVQRELRNGFHKVGRTHLAALGLDPSRVPFDVQMTVPSAIFELAQVEVRNARADLAARMGEHVSLHWLLSNVYNMNEEDIVTIVDQRVDDALRDGVVAVEIESMSAKAQVAAQPAFENIDPSMNRIKARIDGMAAKRKGLVTERELFRGNREAEKRAAEKLEVLRAQGDKTLRRVDEIGQLVQEAVSARRVRK